MLNKRTIFLFFLLLVLHAVGDRCAAISLTQKQRTHVDPWSEDTMMLAITALYSQGCLWGRSNPLGGRSRLMALAILNTGVDG